MLLRELRHSHSYLLEVFLQLVCVDAHQLRAVILFAGTAVKTYCIAFGKLVALRIHTTIRKYPMKILLVFLTVIVPLMLFGCSESSPKLISNDNRDVPISSVSNITGDDSIPSVAKTDNEISIDIFEVADKLVNFAFSQVIDNADEDAVQVNYRLTSSTPRTPDWYASHLMIELTNSDGCDFNSLILPAAISSSNTITQLTDGLKWTEIEILAGDDYSFVINQSSNEIARGYLCAFNVDRGIDVELELLGEDSFADTIQSSEIGELLHPFVIYMSNEGYELDYLAWNTSWGNLPGRVLASSFVGGAAMHRYNKDGNPVDTFGFMLKDERETTCELDHALELEHQLWVTKFKELKLQEDESLSVIYCDSEMGSEGPVAVHLDIGHRVYEPTPTVPELTATVEARAANAEATRQVVIVAAEATATASTPTPEPMIGPAFEVDIPQGAAQSGTIVVEIQQHGAAGVHFVPDIVKITIGSTVSWTQDRRSASSSTSHSGQDESWDSGDLHKGPFDKGPASFDHRFDTVGCFTYESLYSGDTATGAICVVSE